MKKIYLDEIEETSNELIKLSQESIANKINELKLATKNFVWQGPINTSFVKNYNIKIEELIKMNYSLEKIGKFLLIVSDNYNSTNSKINNAYEELLNEFKRAGK